MNEGWGFPYLESQRCHYFVNGISLCGKVVFKPWQLEPDDDRVDPCDCQICSRILKRRKKEASA